MFVIATQARTVFEMENSIDKYTVVSKLTHPDFLAEHSRSCMQEFKAMIVRKKGQVGYIALNRPSGKRDERGTAAEDSDCSQVLGIRPVNSMRLVDCRISILCGL